MEKLSLKSIYTELCRKKYLVISIVLISIIIGTIYSYTFVVPKYKSSATIILGNNSLDSYTTNTVQTNIAMSSNLVSTYSELIKSKTSLNEVKNNLKLDISDEVLRKSINVERVSDSEVIEITVESASPALACNITNETIKVFHKKIKEINSTQSIYVIDKAVVNEEPYNVNHLRDVFVFMSIGFIISVLNLIIIFLSDTTVKSVDDIENEIGLKNLQIIPSKKSENKKGNKNTELIIYEDEKSILKDAFDNLRTNIQFSNIGQKENKILLLTSCFSSEGKSYVSANLAVAFAKAGKKVILIDADMRRGREAKIFNIPNELGLSNYLSNLDKNGMEINERVNKYIKETEVKNLNVITSGNVPPNSAELLTSDRLQELLKELGVFYDLIIIDGAPVLPSADSLILTRLANSTILVTLFNTTKKDELLKAKKDLQNVDGRVIGTVLNRVPMTDLEFVNGNYDLNNNSKNSFFKKNEIRRQIRREKRERIKNEFKGLNFDRDKKEKLSQRLSYSKCKISNLKLKIKDFFGRFKKEETKLLDMSKEEKEVYIRKQKKDRQSKIRREKQALKEQRKLERLEKQQTEEKRQKEEKIESKEEPNNREKVNDIKDNIQEPQIKMSDDINAVADSEKEILNTGKLLENNLKLKSEKNLDEQIEKIELEIKEVSEKIEQENKDANIIDTDVQNDSGKINKFDFSKIKENFNNGINKAKEIFIKGKEEFLDLKGKLSQEYSVKKEENLRKKMEKKAEKDAYNNRKAEDKAERDAIRKEEFEIYKQIRDEERAKQEVIRQEEKRLKEAEKELKRKAKEIEKQELAQKRMAQRGLREAEKENRKNKKEALRMKQKEEARIKEEILEDNLYPKTKYNKDI